MKSCPILIGSLVLASIACGSRTDDDTPFDPGPPVNPAPTTMLGTTFLRVASRGDTLMVVSVDPKTGNVQPFGPALPGPASTYAAWLFFATADARRAMVSLGAPTITSGSGSPADHPALLLVGEGSEWHEVTRSTLPYVVAQPSADLSRIWITTPCDPLQSASLDRHAVFSFAGASLWNDDRCWRSKTFSSVGFAPNGSFVTFADESAVHVVQPDIGRVSSTPTPLNAGTVIASFATSSVVTTSKRTVAWLDANGDPLEVAGAATDTAAVVDPGHHLTRSNVAYQVADRTLSILRDRTVERIQAVPSWVNPNGVYATFAGHYAVVSEAGPSLDLIGLDGTVLLRHEAPPRDGLVAGRGVNAYSFDGRWPWVLVKTNYVTPDTDIGDIASEEELWLPGDPVRGIPARAHRLRSYTNGPIREYFASPSGNEVLYLEDGHLHRIDIATMFDEAIGGDLRWQ